ncbi:MAG: acyltransferase, partial [Proteobacteria bacterium]|nr:acyltransferase [Pseudomonadota bacterium]
MKIGYRKDLDGLRGISIIAVLIYHFFPKALPGGFIGVDVFFSLSGFLITSIILNDIEHGNFSLSSFYSRRIKRLFPALLAVLIVSLITGSSVLTLTEWKRLCKHVIGGATFLSNFLTVSESGYFDAKSERNPLLHLWSLAIEEQFYLIWPAVILLAIRFKIHPMIVAVSLCMLSFLVNLKLSNLAQKNSRRLDQGSQDLALKQVKKDSLSANLVAALGLILIVFGVFYIDRTKVFPGYLALLPTVGTCLVLYTNQPSYVGILLGNPIFRYIGMISYPLYLWHWIVLVFAKNLKSVLTVKDLGFAILISVLLSVATFELVEKPIRKSEKKWLAGVLLLVLAIAGSLGAYFYLAPVKSTATADGAYVTPEEIKTEYERYWKILDYRYFSSPRRVVVFGDSQGYDLFSALMCDTRVGVKIFQSDNFCSGFFDV